MSSIRSNRSACVLILATAALSMSAIPCRSRSANEPGQRDPASARPLSLKSGESAPVALGTLEAGLTYRLLVTLRGDPMPPGDRIHVELAGSGSDRFTKDIHAGDPDIYLPYRPSRDGTATLRLTRT